MTIQVWYHGNCDDGFGAAWAAYRYFKTFKPVGSEVVYKPCFYGKTTPSYAPEDVIYIVDFSYPRNVLELLRTQVKGLTILDHHKTAQEDLKNFPDAIFDMERSGAVLTWSYFHKDGVPLLLRYVQDNDLWRHKLQSSKAIVRYIRTVPHDFAEWDKLYSMFETDVYAVIAKAEAVEAYFQNQIHFNASIAKEIVFHDYACPIINCNTTFISEMLQYLHETHKTEIAMSYFINQDFRAICSLRSAGKVDVSAIAKKYGGGGHHNAAGFTIDLQTLLSILN